MVGQEGHVVLLGHGPELPRVGDVRRAGQTALVVEEGFGRTHRVEDYAARLGYSPRTLTRATRAALGCGAKRFIDDRVLLEAKRLLVHPDLPQATIGERVGFAHPTVFSAFFRQHTGMTPTEFRSVTQS
ncbi:helix-turn-helix transcriptional regulator [Streptomyces sp. NPDC060311]|uniref:helix-turn-helix transcriptional regulator n=1 Tax=Streptomyces sp. NPDC060311 TaxID=3347096 RepID=UPI003657E3C7